MRSFALVALPVASMAMDVANNLAVMDDNRAVELPGLVRYPVEGKQVPRLHRPHRRQQEVDVNSVETGQVYLLTLKMGTPGKDVTVEIDTGSNELWVNPDCSTGLDKELCSAQPRYETSSSTVPLHTKGNITYGTDTGGGSGVYFDYVKDTVAIGSAKIRNQIFGDAYKSSGCDFGIMGLGPSQAGWDTPEYPMVVDSLTQQGLTSRRAFSLDLHAMQSPRGSMIFGGADTKKFQGKLVKRPITTGLDGLPRYWIDITGLSIDGRLALAKGAVQPVVFDSGAGLSYLPAGLVNNIAAAFRGAQYLEKTNQWNVPCEYRNQDKTIDFEFGAATIKVSYNDFIWEPEAGQCFLGVIGTKPGDNTFLLGPFFLRAAYVVFDQDTKSIWLAQSADCGTNLVPFGKGPNGVKALEGDCGKPPVTSSSTTTTTTTTKTTHSSTPSSTRTSSSTHVTTSKTTTTGPGRSSSTSITTVPSNSTTVQPTNGTTITGAPTYTSTYLTTTTYTITSCPPVVTDCPVGHVTTEIITSYTTWCPGEQTPTNTPIQPTSQPGGEQPSSHCTGSNCSKPSGPSSEQPGSNCPGPNCVKPTSKPGGGEQPSGMSSTVKPCPTCGSGGKKPTSSGAPIATSTAVVPTAAAAEMFRVSGVTAIIVAVAVFVL